MPDGSELGETKYLVNKNNGTVTITPDNLQNYSTITLGVNNSVICVWDGLDWIVISTGNDSAGGILA